jgi:hypothetical protein
LGGSGTDRAVYCALRGRLHQRADVEQHRHLAGVEGRHEGREAGRQRVLAAVGQRRRRVEHGTGEPRTVERDVGPQVAVGIVAGEVVRHDGVGVVVAAIEEYADQGLVVGRALGGGLAHRGEIECEGQRRAGHRELARTAQEGAARVALGIDEVHDLGFRFLTSG